jgi:ceramide glucosyltransferase
VYHASYSDCGLVDTGERSSFRRPEAGTSRTYEAADARQPNRDAPSETGKIVLLALRLIVLILALGPIVYYLLSLYCIIDYFLAAKKLSRPADSIAPPASILKPVRGVDQDAYENFASFCRLDYPEYELIFAVADPKDPAIPIIEKLQRDFPSRSVRLVTSVQSFGENPKVNNLCTAVRAAKYDLLVMSDADVRVDQDYLREVAAPFADPAVGAVTALYRCLGGGTLAADLDMLGMCTDSIPGAVVARKLEGNVRFAFGWTMATTKKNLAEIGGWESMADHHSDDFELGNRIADRGHRVHLMRKPVWMVFPEETMPELLRHEMRWAIGLKNVRPAGYAGMIFTQGLPWTVLAAIAAASVGWHWIAAAYALAYLVLRIGAAWAAGVWGLGDGAIAGKLWLVPFRDALGSAVWVAGFFSNKIRWRGLEYRVEKKILVPVLSSSGERHGKASEQAVKGG